MWLRRLWRRLHGHRREDCYYPLVYLPAGGDAGMPRERGLRPGTRDGPPEGLRAHGGTKADRWQTR